MSDLRERLHQSLAGRYEVIAELGQGGMATVFRARDLRHGREVALKAIHPVIAMALGTERFAQEIAHTARLAHPHILPLLDSGVAGNLPFYVIPLVSGASLRARLEREGQLPIAEALRITEQVADALAYAHRQGLVHRDIKPENILLQDSQALVADFGVARDLDAADRLRLTETGISVGTPLYMSPEQGSADPRIDGRSDQYSLACVLYEMLAGSPPFTGGSQQAVLARHSRDPVPPVSTVRPTVPAAMEAALARALEKTPADRFATTTEFAAALTAEAATGIAPVPRSPPWRRRVTASLLIGGLLLIGGGAAIRLLRGGTRALPLDPHRVAVIPFITRCTGALSTWCEGITELLSATFTGVGEYSAVDSRAVHRLARRAGAGAAGEWEQQLARDLGAGAYVVGSVTESGGELRLNAAVFRTSGDQRPVAEATVQGSGSEVFRLVDDLAEQVMAGLDSGESRRVTRLAAATTTSLNALKLFLGAEARVRAGQFDSALTLLHGAVMLDSTFTLGWTRLAEVAGFVELDEVRPAAERAARGIGRLPWRDSMLVAAMLAPFEVADRAYQEMLRRDSADAGAWGAWGDLIIHEAASRGRSFAESQDAFERAIALGDSSWRNINHLNWAAGVRGDSAGYAAGLHLALTRFPDGFMAPIHRLELAVVQGDTAQTSAALLALRGHGALMAWGAAQRLAITGYPRAAQGPAALLTASEQPLVVQALGHQMLAAFAAAQGRWREAQRELVAATRLDPAGGGEIGAYLAMVPGLPVGRESLDSLAALLSRVRLPSRRGAGDLMFPHEGAHPVVREYLLGLLAARLGDRPGTNAAVKRLASLPPTVMTPAVVASLRSREAILEGRLADGLRQLETAPSTGDAMAANGSPFFAAVDDRVTRADLLDRLGRPAEALAWYQNTGAVSLFDVAYLPHALLRSAEILERLRRPADARARYRRFLELWQNADPELRPQLERVRDRLAGPGLSAPD